MTITNFPEIQKDANVTGLLVVGGEGGLQSVEFWAPPPLSGSDTNHGSADILSGWTFCQEDVLSEPP